MCPNQSINEDLKKRHMKMVHFEFVQLVWEKCQICADFYPNPEEFTKHKCSQSEEDQLKWALEQSKLEHSTLFDYLLNISMETLNLLLFQHTVLTKF